MPATYAHYRFARQVASSLPDRIHKAVQKGSALYLAGCHGPDPMFYYDPFRKNAVDALGARLHAISGKELFDLGCRQLRKNPSPRGCLYLYGLLTHYCLDTGCHPFVNDLAQRGICNHTELETEFDRFLLELDGVTKPHTRDLGVHLMLTAADCREAAACYPGMTPQEFRRSVRNMRLAIKILSGRSVLPRPLLEKTLPAFSDNVRYQLMSKGPNTRVSQWNEKLMAFYDQSLERFPGLARQLGDHVTRGIPLGDDFSAIMG